LLREGGREISGWPRKGVDGRGAAAAAAIYDGGGPLEMIITD
jgi:hypothetical protein